MIIKRLFLCGIVIFLLLVCVAGCNNNEGNTQTQTSGERHPSDPKPLAGGSNDCDYDKITVSLPQTVYSLSQDFEIRADVKAYFKEDQRTSVTYFVYPNIEKWENGQWVRYYNPGYDSREDLGIETWPLPGWLCLLRNTFSVGVTISDIDPEMTPGHYRMIVYLANDYTYYLEFDLVA